ncbi:MAG: substrate-binding domain-containing protein [Candidatus Sumerlaeia bacterium]
MPTILKAELASAPVYQQVEYSILKKIHNGEYGLGSRLPGSKALANEYHTAYGTIHRALSKLAHEGFLRVENGRGSFVARVPDEMQLREVLSNGNGAGHKVDRSLAKLTFNFGKLLRPAIIGVIGSTDLAPQGRNWSPVLFHHLERVISNAGGAMKYYERYRPDSNDFIPLPDMVEGLRRDKVDAVILNGVHYPLEDSAVFVRALGMEGPPAACVCWEPLDVHIPHCYYGNREGGFVAGDHLLRMGYSRFVFASPFKEPWEKERLEGVRQAIRQFGFSEKLIVPIELDSSWKGRKTRTVSMGQTAARHILFSQDGPLAEEAGPWAIIAPNDAFAMGVLSEMKRQGINPGNQVGLIGFDDDDSSQVEGLSTVRLPLEELANVAAGMVVNQLNGHSAPAQVCCSPEVVARASTFRR